MTHAAANTSLDSAKPPPADATAELELSPGAYADALVTMRHALDAAAQTLHAASSRRVQTLASADAQRDQAIAEADATLAEAIARAERHAADLRAQSEDRYVAKTSKAQNDRARVIERARRELGERAAVAKKNRSEATWLAETVCEAAVGKARGDHDKFKARLAEIAQQMSELDAALLDTLGPANAARLAELPPREAAPVDAASFDMLKAAMEAAREAVAEVGGGGVMKLLRSRSSTLDMAQEARARIASVKALSERLAVLSEAQRDAAIAAAKKKRDAEIAEVSAEASQIITECERSMAGIQKDADGEYATKAAEIDSKRTADLAKIESWEREQRELAERTHREALARAAQAHEQSAGVVVATALHEEELARAGLVERLRPARANLAAIEGHIAHVCPAWSDAAWTSREHPTRVPRLLPVGRVRLSLKERIARLDDQARQMAALAPEHEGLMPFALPGPLSLHVQHDAAGRADALAMIRSLMLRILGSFPAGKVRFTMTDPIGLGQSFAGFMRLSDQEPSPVGLKIWSDTAQIERQLADLTEHMQTVIQKYLRSDFATIEEYNVAAGEIAEPYRFIIIADMHSALSDTGAARLASIIDSGPRCGVYAIMASEIGKRIPAALPLATLKSKLVSLQVKDGSTTIDDARFDECVLSLDAPPDDALLREILDRVADAGKNAGRVEVAFERLVPGDAEVWSRSCDTELAIPLGRSGAQKIQHLRLGSGTRQHALIAGRTGSGKSTLLHVMISAAALWHSPDELEFYLIDFKKGVEFKAYCDGAMPHVRAVAIESDREFGLSVLRRLDEELMQRGDLFRKLRAQDLAAARRAEPTARLPRVLLLIDEFQEFFVVDDNVASESALLLDRLVRQGRAFGVHVVLGSQTLAGAYSLARSTLGQMGVRIALQCSEADAHLILDDDNDGARLLTRPGEAIYNDAGGLSEGNSPFQTAWLSDAVRDGQLRRMADRLTPDKLGKSASIPPPVVFEGNAPARLDVSLAALSSAFADVTTPRAIIGDAVSIAPPVFATLRKRSGGNVLVVGAQAEAALGIAGAMCVSLACTPELGITLIDPTLEDDPLVGRLPRSLSSCGVPASSLRMARAADAAGVVREFAAEVDARQGGAAGSPRVLVLAGLHRLRELRKSEDFGFSLDDDKGSAYASLERVIRDGPGVGIWTVAWCDSLTTLERVMARPTIREFGLRVLMQMNASDSAGLMDSSAASQLGPNRVMLVDTDAGTNVKARPIELPDLPTAARVATLLRG
ncbi:MAG: FtsK/SpoIIIE domain-containing protein [Planctomycetota bacterium]|nr:FtsK/SpoIIIE domain-containing protein [Planctomycetota bacterium]